MLRPMVTAAVIPDTQAKETTVDELAGILSTLKSAQRKAGPPSYDERIARLEKLEKAILAHRDEFVKAIAEDFGSRSAHETLIAEIFMSVAATKHCREHLHEWMESEPRPVSWLFAPAHAEVMYQPLGVVGIIAPWNYPVNLAFGPLAGVLAAGNRAIIKPSELTPKTGAVIARLVEKTFSPDEVRVVLGGPALGAAFSKLPFDHLVFTGSTTVGKIVMREAAANLVPVTLELGGKSPAIIADDFPIDVAATRIMHGKLFNAGQTCIAPDYVLVPKKELSRFVEECQAAVAKMYPTLKDNKDYTSVINARHYDRLKGLLDEAKDKGAKLVEMNPAKEELSAESRKLAPTIVLDAKDDMALLKDEIFGPILPVIPYDKLEDAIDYVNDRPRPLALYVFSHEDDVVTKINERTVAGGVSVNETLMHFGQDDLPFGGVGDGGMGHYHGRDGFETFSKKKPVFHQARINGTGLLRPPFGKAIDLAMRFLLGK